MFWRRKKKEPEYNEFKEQLNRIESLFTANRERVPTGRRQVYGDTVRYFMYGGFAEATPIQSLEKKEAVRLMGFRNAIARYGYISQMEAYVDSNNLVRLRRID